MQMFRDFSANISLISQILASRLLRILLKGNSSNNPRSDGLCGHYENVSASTIQDDNSTWNRDESFPSFETR